MKNMALVVIACGAVACSGSSSNGDVTGGGANASSPVGDPLYEAPAGASTTAGDIFGLWGGTLVEGQLTLDYRYKLSADAISAANRCLFPDGTTITTGVSVDARVTKDEISSLGTDRDEKKKNDNTCRIEIRAYSLAKCKGDKPAGFETECFVLEGTKLTMYGKTPLEKQELVKIADEK